MLKAKLVIVGGDAKAGEIGLQLPTTIGRGKEADLTIPHALVSRAHSKLFEREGLLWVEDLGSLNGTFVNNTRIESEQVIEPNQLLTLGNITFRAVYEINESARKTLPSTHLPDSMETITIDPIRVQQTAPTPSLPSDDYTIAADAETDFAETNVAKTNFAETVAETEPVFEEASTPQSAISEIDSFDPEEIGSLDSLSEKIDPQETAPEADHPRAPSRSPAAAESPQPILRTPAKPTKPKVSPGVQPATPQEAAIDLGIPASTSTAAISSVEIDIDLPDNAKAAPVSFVGKIQTDDNNTASFVDDFHLDLESDQQPEADVDVARLDSFLKKLPK